MEFLGSYSHCILDTAEDNFLGNPKKLRLTTDHVVPQSAGRRIGRHMDGIIGSDANKARLCAGHHKQIDGSKITAMEILGLPGLVLCIATYRRSPHLPIQEAQRQQWIALFGGLDDILVRSLDCMTEGDLLAQRLLRTFRERWEVITFEVCPKEVNLLHKACSLQDIGIISRAFDVGFFDTRIEDSLALPQVTQDNVLNQQI